MFKAVVDRCLQDAPFSLKDQAERLEMDPYNLVSEIDGSNFFNINGDQVALSSSGEAAAAALRKKRERKPNSTAALADLTEEEKAEAEKLLKGPDLLTKVLDDLDRLIVGETHNKLLTFLLMAGRVIEPQHIIFAGEASAGKSYLINTLALYFRPDVISVTRLSPAALDYLEGDLTNKILVVQEMTGVQYADSLRPLLSNDQGGLSLLVPEKGSDGRIQTVKRTLTGEPVFVTSTTGLGIEHQLQTRVWTLFPDDSKGQTERIIQQKKDNAAAPWVEAAAPSPVIVAALSLLKNHKVVIPFADRLLVPTDSVRARRDVGKLLSLVKVVAWLHQRQREVSVHDGISYIVAEPVDALMALAVARVAFENTYSEIDHRLKVFLSLFPPNEWLTARELAERVSGYSQETCRRYCRCLVSKGQLLVDDSGRSHLFKVGKWDKVGQMTYPTLTGATDADYTPSGKVGQGGTPLIFERLEALPLSQYPTSGETDTKRTQRSGINGLSHFVPLSHFDPTEGLPGKEMAAKLREKFQKSYLKVKSDVEVIKESLQNGVIHEVTPGRYCFT